MTCRDVVELISAAVDGELDAKALERLQVHIDACSDCRREIELEEMTKRFVRRSLPRTEAPPYLHQRIREQLVEQSRHEIVDPSPFSRRSPWLSRLVVVGSGAAAVALLLLFIVTPARMHHLHTQPTDNDIIHQTYNNFDAALDGKIVPEIASSDPAVVKSFLKSRISYPVAVPQLKQYRLVGGTSSHYNNESVAQLMYSNNRDLVYLYQANWKRVCDGGCLHISPKICDELRRTGWYVESHKPDCSLILWLSDSTVCCAVADVNPDQLLASFKENK